MVTIQAGIDASIAFRFPENATAPAAVIPWPTGSVQVPVSIVGGTVVASLPASLTEPWPVGTADLTVTAKVQGGRITIGVEPVAVRRDVQTRRDLRAACAAALEANTTYLKTADPASQVTALTKQVNALIRLVNL